MNSEIENFDRILAEALSSDAVPSAEFMQRLMTRVEHTPQDAKISYFPRKYISAIAACLAIALISIPVLKQTQPFGMSSKSAAESCEASLAAPAMAPAEMPVATGASSTSVETYAEEEAAETSVMDQEQQREQAMKEVPLDTKSEPVVSFSVGIGEPLVIEDIILSQSLYQAFQDHDIVPECIDDGTAIYSLSDSARGIITEIAPELILDDYSTIELSGIHSQSR